MFRLSKFAMPLLATGQLLVQCLLASFFWSLPMVGAFDMSVNTNVSCHSVLIFSPSHFVPAGRVSSDVCSRRRLFELATML